MAMAGQKTTGSACGCCGSNCAIFSDTFDRAAEDFSGLDSTGEWSGSGSVGISAAPANVLYFGPGGGKAVWQGMAPVDFSASVDVWFVAPGDKARITWQIVGAGGSGAGKRYRVEIEPSDQDQFLDLDHTHCGTLRLFDVTNLGSPVQLGGDIPIPGLTYSGDIETPKPAWHRLQLCYIHEINHLSCSVKTADDKTFAHHAKNQTIPGGPYTDSEIWLEAVCVFALFMDNFAVSETKSHECCPCTADTLQFSDDFDRSPEFISNPGPDSTGHWFNATPTNRWSVTNLPFGHLYIDRFVGDPHVTALIDAVPSLSGAFSLPLSASCDVHLPNDGAESQIMFLIGPYGMRASLKAGVNGVLAIKNNAVLAGVGTVLAQKMISNVPYGAVAPPDGSRLFHTLTLCYDGHCVTVSVALSDGRSYKVRTEIGYFTGSGPVWLIVPYKAGRYAFENFSVSTANLAPNADSDFGYGAGPGCDNGCKCCGPNDCGTVTLAFPDDDTGIEEGSEDDSDTIDCRLQISGTVVKEDGFLIMSDGAQVTVLISSSGLNTHCLPDNTIGAVAEATFPDYGSGLSIFVGSASATLTINSALDAADGSLTLSTGETAVMDINAGDSVTLGAALSDGLFIGAARGVVLSGDAGTGETVSLVASGEVKLSGLSMMPCIDGENAEKFFDQIGFGHGPPYDCGPCRFPDGRLSSSLLLLIGGLGVGPGEFGPDLNGAFVLPSGGCPGATLIVCEWCDDFIRPQPNFGSGEHYYLVIDVGFDLVTRVAYIQVIITIQEFGVITPVLRQAAWYKEVPLGDDDLIDCQSLLGDIPFRFQASWADAANAVILVEE